MKTFKRPPVTEMITVLEEVKLHISNFTSKYICLALESVGTDFKLSNTAHYLKNYIEKQLGYSWDGATLDRWLYDYRPEIPKSYILNSQYRIKWIDWMLEGLKEELTNENAKR